MKPKNVAHTPGPWTVESAHEKTPNTFRVRANLSFRKHVSTEESVCITGSEANAHLIAAAPELLEALENLIDFAETLAADGGRSADLREAYEAIKKARGGDM